VNKGKAIQILQVKNVFLNKIVESVILSWSAFEKRMIVWKREKQIYVLKLQEEWYLFFFLNRNSIFIHPENPVEPSYSEQKDFLKRLSKHKARN